MILYYAPGAGLGHLTRALAICLPLRDMGLDARIATDSPFAAGIAALARQPVIEIGSRENEGAKLVITDTFPYGIHNEWRNADKPLIHIARRLRKPLPMQTTDFLAIIEAEPGLGIPGSTKLPGPIRLAPGRIPTKPPAPLTTGGLTLVVHSGLAEEIAQLVALADSDPVVISPFAGIDYYPAQNLYAQASRIITGAGYNAMADGLWIPGKHTAHAFERTYDDQRKRLEQFFREPVDGTANAVNTIVKNIPR